MDLSPLVNLIITSICQGRCPYCFNHSVLKQEPSGVKSDHMSLENFSYALDFMKRSGIENVRLLGGEPLLHPQIGSFLDLIKESNFQGVTIFTSGLFPENKLEMLGSLCPRIILNLNHPKVYASGQFQTIMKNLGTIVDKGFKVTIGYNIYEEDFDYQFVIDTARDYDVECIRLCIANPSTNVRTQVLDKEARNAIGCRFTSMIEECAKHRLEVVFDCVLPPCYFTDEQWGRLAKLYPKSIGKCGVCSPALDIDKDLKVHRCFALGDVDTADLHNFPNSNELLDYFGDRIDKFKWIAVPAYCRECSAFLLRNCQGDCIAFHHNELQRLKKMDLNSNALYDDAYKKLRIGDIVSAKDSFQRGMDINPFKTKAVCDYLFILLREGDFDEAVHLLEKHEKIYEHDTSGPYHLIKGIITEGRGDNTTAISHYRKALRSIDPEHKDYLKSRLAGLRENIAE